MKTEHTLSRIGKRAAFGLALVMLVGCAGYQLGSMLPPDIDTVHVPTFINGTEEPQLEAVTTRETIRELQRDGSLKLADAATADTVLRVKLTQLYLRALDYDEDRRAEVEEYRLIADATFVLMRQSTGEVIAEGQASGREEFEVVGDLTSSKDTALPGLARDLAHNIVEKVVEAW